MNFLDKAIEDAGGNNNPKVMIIEEKSDFFDDSLKGKVQRQSFVITIFFIGLLICLFTTANASHNGNWGTSILTYGFTILFCAVSTGLGIRGLQKIQNYKQKIKETDEKVSLRYLRFISIVSMCSLVIYYLVKYLTSIYLPAQPFGGL